MKSPLRCWSRRPPQHLGSLTLVAVSIRHTHTSLFDTVRPRYRWTTGVLAADTWRIAAPIYSAAFALLCSRADLTLERFISAWKRTPTVPFWCPPSRHNTLSEQATCAEPEVDSIDEEGHEVIRLKGSLHVRTSSLLSRHGILSHHRPAFLDLSFMFSQRGGSALSNVRRFFGAVRRNGND